MNLDKYINSQTLKTGMFVIAVLLVFLFVFKLGVVHGHKKAIHSQIYGHNSGQMIYRGASFGHHRRVFNKDIYREFLLQKKLIKDETVLDSKMDKESEAVDLAQ